MTNRRNARNDYDSHFNIVFSMGNNSEGFVDHFSIPIYDLLRN